MNRNLRLLALALFAALISHAQDRTYDYASIPDSMKAYANAVVRYEKTDIKIAHAGKMTLRKEKVVTILNSKGDYHGYVRLHYDDQTQVKQAEVQILDRNGELIDRIRKSEFNDVSAVPNGTLFSDSRYLYYDPVSNNYPYTVVISWETTTSDTAFIHPWTPLDWYYVSTEQHVYKLSFPPEMHMNYKKYNLEGYAIDEMIEPGNYHFEVTDAKAMEKESLSPDHSSVLPSIYFSADEFSLGKEKGKAQNLLEFGRWWYDHLLAGTDDVPEVTKEKVRALVRDTEDPREKAKRVYQYVQDNTRYISVQVGIGGWKPMLASEVDRLGYGDCKALTNYTRALLNAAGVPSFYSRVYAGRGQRKPLDPELSFMMSNHVILMVPLEEETIWLECTNQKIPFGHLGDFTDDRDALVITPEGGKIMHTKSYPAKMSAQTLTGSVVLNQDGSIKADLSIRTTGIQFDRAFSILDMDERDKELYYKDFFDQVNNIELNKTEASVDMDQVEMREDLSFTADAYASITGDDLLFRINVFNVNNNIPKRDRNRTLPLEIKYGYADYDQVIINLPENIRIASIPDSKILETKFGSYEISVEEISDRQLQYKRKIIINQGNYSVEDYNAYRSFKKKINQMDQIKILLTKTQKT